MEVRRRTTNTKTFKIALIATSALLLTAVIFAQRQAIYDQLYGWKLIPRPERLTELYFTDHTNLPTTYTPGESQVVKFTVRNLEYRDTTYKYQVTIEGEEDDDTATTIGDGSLKLMHEQTEAIVEEVVLLDKGLRAKVTVILTYDGIAFGEDEPSKQTQSIHYWVTKEGV